MKVFAFVDRQRAEFAVKTLCRVCRVSTSGYYDWIARRDGGPSAAVIAEEELVDQIRLVHAESRDNYGEPRITAQLAREGVVVNHKRVQRLMARHGIAGRCSRPKVRTTLQDPTATPFADLVERDFARDGLDELCMGDLTYVATDEGWVYVSGVSDIRRLQPAPAGLVDHRPPPHRRASRRPARGGGLPGR